MSDNLPKGIPFFRISTGETLYAKLEPQIMAFVNSSDMGVNASRGQDYKWRLAPEWVKKEKAFRRDEAKMGVLTALNGGNAPTTTQILFAIYDEQWRAARERASEDETPFEEAYQEAIKDKPEVVDTKSK